MKGETLFTFIGGALIGAAAAILLAPDSGTETRKKIKKGVEKEYQEIKDKIQKAKEDLEDELSEMKERVEEEEATKSETEAETETEKA
ncbi:MAG: YtxH domain-containing protein [Bacteroidales bacterium]